MTTPDQRSDDAATDDEGEDKTVDRVPGWGPTTPGSSAVGVVKEVESQELSDQRIFDGKQKGRPSDSRGDDTNCVTLVALSTSVSSPFKAPMDRAEERDNLD